MSKVIERILNRNGYSFEEKGVNNYVIQQSKKGNDHLKLYLFSSLGICISGLFFLYLGSIFGLILLIISIPGFLKVANQNKHFHSLSRRKIELKPGKLNIIDDIDSNREITIDKITTLNFYTEKDKQISTGTIELGVNEEETEILIELFGDDKRYVEDDTKMLVNFIAEILNKE